MTYLIFPSNILASPLSPSPSSIPLSIPKPSSVGSTRPLFVYCHIPTALCFPFPFPVSLIRAIYSRLITSAIVIRRVADKVHGCKVMVERGCLLLAELGVGPGREGRVVRISGRVGLFCYSAISLSRSDLFPKRLEG